MKQLSGLDSTFLHLETSAQFGHVSGLSIFSRPDTPGYQPYEAWRGQLERRLHLLEPLRRRLAEVPLGLDHPYWIADPDFDIDFHVRHSAIPPPGRDEQLAALVGRLISLPLDRRRPLWLSYVIEGLADERFAVLTIVHHATVDGASGVELMTIMFDDDAEGGDVEPETERWTPEAAPSDLQMLARGALGLARKPGRGILLTAWTAREIGRATRNPTLVGTANQVRRSLRGPLGTVLNLGRKRPEEPDQAPALPSIRPPGTPFNGPITPHRKLAIRSTSLSDVKAIKSGLDATVNDVVLAACAGGLRTWLDRRGALPEDPLVALIPVSIRTGDETDKWTNRVSMLLADLPTDEPDPVQRVRRVHDSMASSKGIHEALPAERLTDFAEFPPPAVFARAMRLSARLRLGSRLTPGNLVISNVPGPREPLFAAGARLEHYYPLSTIIDGQGLNITVQSYLDRLDWGLVACADLVPDVEAVLDDIIAELDALAAATSTRPPAKRRRRPPARVAAQTDGGDG